MKNTSEAYPLRAIEFEGVHFRETNMGKGGLGNVLDSIREGTNIWLKSDGAPMRPGIDVYNKELLPGILLVAFDTEEARSSQVNATSVLEGKDIGKYTLPDITTFFEIEKDGKMFYCYVVDRMDMWKHKKDMLIGEMDDVSIDGVVVYPSGIQYETMRTGEEVLVQGMKDAVKGII